MPDFKQRQEIARGQLAKDVLQSEIYREAWQSVETAIIQKWRDCPIRDTDGQHELKLMLKLLGDVRGYLENTMASGKMAQIELDRERERNEKLRRIYPGAA